MAGYSVDEEIDTFFRQTTATRAECDERALTLVGGAAVVPVAVQGVCSYTVYAGEDLEHVVQFRLSSLELPTETTNLARTIYGNFAPEVSVHGRLGVDRDGGGEPLLVYVMSRIKGISHLDFILAYGYPENTPENFARRKTLIADVARFFALSWKARQPASFAWQEKIYNEYRRELELLLGALPERFHPTIRRTIDGLTAIISLPMVLLHKDFGSSNIIVSKPSCHLVGVVDWAEAAIGPFGTNLHSLLPLYGKVMLQRGIILFEDHALLQETFWDVFLSEVGGLSDKEVTAIKAARILGLLCSKGFSSRLGNKLEPVPIGDDETGSYNMLYLDGLLLNPATRFD